MLHDGERFNTLSHLAGFVLGVVGLIALVAQFSGQAPSLHATGALVFALAVLFLYAASTLCHCSLGASKVQWQRMDHAAIFVLIAGTATPFALRFPDDVWSWVGLAGVWALAAVGVAQALGRKAGAAPSVAMYVAVGWIAVAVAFHACLQLPAAASALLIAGGLIYTAGTVFYVNPRGLRHAHGIWHLFVLLGTGTHYAAVVAVVG
ncbi:MAG: hemolysin III family protein [Comamonadaceae bacterium]|nr:MAG: hemolysin III family protein [Comamonadaceae bacterium]